MILTYLAIGLFPSRVAVCAALQAATPVGAALAMVLPATLWAVAYVRGLLVRGGRPETPGTGTP